MNDREQYDAAIDDAIDQVLDGLDSRGCQVESVECLTSDTAVRSGQPVIARQHLTVLTNSGTIRVTADPGQNVADVIREWREALAKGDGRIEGDPEEHRAIMRAIGFEVE